MLILAQTVFSIRISNCQEVLTAHVTGMQEGANMAYVTSQPTNICVINTDLRYLSTVVRSGPNRQNEPIFKLQTVSVIRIIKVAAIDLPLTISFQKKFHKNGIEKSWIYH